MYQPESVVLPIKSHLCSFLNNSLIIQIIGGFKDRLPLGSIFGANVAK